MGKRNPELGVRAGFLRRTDRNERPAAFPNLQLAYLRLGQKRLYPSTV